MSYVVYILDKQTNRKSKCNKMALEGLGDRAVRILCIVLATFQQVQKHLQV